MAFLYIEKAYDGVCRSMVWVAMRCTMEFELCERWGRKIWFEQRRRLKQRSALSTLLYIVVVEKFMQRVVGKVENKKQGLWQLQVT
ncbi:hypothetical protein PR048_031566 [Dryococelus australis]|uniref:Uncharacterized protein n=1 Tax=Dryococelus australis TaxID=614101 RepID=A0ABQ9G8L8_9NEOP|nr:hypothetical protein PR048_031566 [Dryococelus australis]